MRTEKKKKETMVVQDIRNEQCRSCWSSGYGVENGVPYVFCGVRAFFLTTKQSRISQRDAEACPGPKEKKKELEALAASEKAPADP